MAIGTQVSKAHPAIKKILAASVDAERSKWRGRLIFVDQVSPSWTYRHYNSTGEPHVYRVVLGDYTTALRIPPPSYAGPAPRMGAPSGGEAILVREIGHTGTITIYVPKLDVAQLDVARDALMSGDKKLAKKVLADLAPYDGIASAVIEAQTKSLAQVTEGKTSRQLSREVASFMQGRKG